MKRSDTMQQFICEFPGIFLQLVLNWWHEKSSDVYHYFHSRVSITYYTNRGFKLYTLFSAFLLQYRTNSTLMCSTNKVRLTSPSFQWTSPGTRADIAFPPPDCSEVVDNSCLPINIYSLYSHRISENYNNVWILKNIDYNKQPEISYW